MIPDEFTTLWSVAFITAFFAACGLAYPNDNYEYD